MISGMDIQLVGLVLFTIMLFVMATLYVMRRRSRLGKRKPKF
jgi:UDP-N-acetylmuramyl pentapeptide phosphotransferase/UDP-N-acetylglucosamine-1-phosphate transferase